MVSASHFRRTAGSVGALVAGGAVDRHVEALRRYVSNNMVTQRQRAYTNSPKARIYPLSRGACVMHRSIGIDVHPTQEARQRCV